MRNLINQYKHQVEVLTNLRSKLLNSELNETSNINLITGMIGDLNYGINLMMKSIGRKRFDNE